MTVVTSLTGISGLVSKVSTKYNVRKHNNSPAVLCENETQFSGVGNNTRCEYIKYFDLR
jgi:hypothetical protein